MPRLRLHVVGAAALAATIGCSPWVRLPEPAEQAGSSSGSSGSGTASGTSGSTGTTSDSCGLTDHDCPPEPVTFGTSAGTEGTDSASFIIDPTCTGGEDDTAAQPKCSWIPCSVSFQDCPRGEKCAPWANDGSDAWNATRCSPISPDAAPDGEPCTVEGSGVSGIDNCELGTMCWDVDPETLTGTCVPLCGGDQANPVCDGADRVCVLSNDGVIALCLPGCDPRDPIACRDGQGCYSIDEVFACVPVGANLFVSNGPDDFGCRFPASCEPGNLCTEDEVTAQCYDPPCCAAWCDTVNPDPGCPEGTACTPYYDEGTAPTGLETLGWCAPAAP